MEDPALVRQLDPMFHGNAEHYGTLSGMGGSGSEYGAALDIFKQKEKQGQANNGLYVDLEGFYEQRPQKMLKPNNFDVNDIHYQSSPHWNMSLAQSSQAMGGMSFGSQQNSHQQQCLTQHIDAYSMAVPHMQEDAVHPRTPGSQVDSGSSPVSVGTNACKLDGGGSLDGLRGSSPLSSIEYVQQGKQKPGFFPPNVNGPRLNMPNPPPAAKSTGHTQDHIMAERKRREKLSQRFIALSAIVPGLKKVCTMLFPSCGYVHHMCFLLFFFVLTIYCYFVFDNFFSFVFDNFFVFFCFDTFFFFACVADGLCVCARRCD
jgi:hypothetical protein